MAVKIITDSTSDLPKVLANKLNIEIVPLKVNFGDKSYRDGIDLTPVEFYELQASSKELPTSSQVNPAEFIEVFERVLESGDEILGIFIAEELSGTLASAKIAKDTIGSDKIHLFDSRGTSGALGLIAIEAGKMALEGKSTSEIIQVLKEYPDKTESAIIVDTLEFLVKGGRLSKTQGFAGNILNIKPIIQVKNGKISTKDKSRGRVKAVKWVLDWIKSSNFDLSDKTLFLLSANDSDFHEKLKSNILKEHSPKEIIDAEVGSVIGTHTGPGCAGIIFINK